MDTLPREEGTGAPLSLAEGTVTQQLLQVAEQAQDGTSWASFAARASVVAVLDNGQTLAVPAEATADAASLTAWVAAARGTPEAPLVLLLAGKPLTDARCLTREETGVPAGPVFVFPADHTPLLDPHVPLPELPDPAVLGEERSAFLRDIAFSNRDSIKGQLRLAHAQLMSLITAIEDLQRVYTETTRREHLVHLACDALAAHAALLLARQPDLARHADSLLARLQQDAALLAAAGDAYAQSHAGPPTSSPDLDAAHDTHAELLTEVRTCVDRLGRDTRDLENLVDHGRPLTPADHGKSQLDAMLLVAAVVHELRVVFVDNGIIAAHLEEVRVLPEAYAGDRDTRWCDALREMFLSHEPWFDALAQRMQLFAERVGARRDRLAAAHAHLGTVRMRVRVAADARAQTRSTLAVLAGRTEALHRRVAELLAAHVVPASVAALTARATGADPSAEGTETGDYGRAIAWLTRHTHTPITPAPIETTTVPAWTPIPEADTEARLRNMYLQLGDLDRNLQAAAARAAEAREQLIVAREETAGLRESQLTTEGPGARPLTAVAEASSREAHSQELEAQARDIARREDQLQRTHYALDEKREALHVLKAQLDQQAAAISARSTTLDDERAALASLQGQLQVQAASLAAQEEAVAEKETALETQAAKMADQEGILSSLREEVEGERTAVAALQTQLEAQAIAIAARESDVTNRQAALDALAAEVASREQALGVEQESLRALKAALQQQTTDLAAEQQKTTERQAALDALAADLASREETINATTPTPATAREDADDPDTDSDGAPAAAGEVSASDTTPLDFSLAQMMASQHTVAPGTLQQAQRALDAATKKLDRCEMALAARDQELALARFERAAALRRIGLLEAEAALPRPADTAADGAADPVRTAQLEQAVVDLRTALAGARDHATAMGVMQEEEQQRRGELEAQMRAAAEENAALKETLDALRAQCMQLEKDNDDLTNEVAALRIALE